MVAGEATEVADGMVPESISVPLFASGLPCIYSCAAGMGLVELLSSLTKVYAHLSRTRTHLMLSSLR